MCHVCPASSPATWSNWPPHSLLLFNRLQLPCHHLLNRLQLPHHQLPTAATLPSAQLPAAAMLPPAQPPVASTLLLGPVASLPEPEVSMPEGPALPKPEVLWAVWTCHAHARGLFFVGTYSTYHSLSCSATVGSSSISLVISHATPPLDLWSASELFLCHCQICSRPPEQFLHRCRTRVALGLMNIVIQ